MKKFALLFAGGLLALSGCVHMRGIQGSGVRKTEKRDVAPFKSIESDGAYDDAELTLIRWAGRKGFVECEIRHYGVAFDGRGRRVTSVGVLSRLAVFFGRQFETVDARGQAHGL